MKLADRVRFVQVLPTEPQPPSVLTTSHKEGDPVLTVNLDRHKPGYMAAYMRKRRSKGSK